MIEKDVSQLDQDFITIWSYYILYLKSGMDGLTERTITSLAEQGQINAIQSYYLFNEPGNNTVIDNHVLTLEYKSGLHFNEKFAIYNYYESHDKSQNNKKQLYEEIEARMKAKKWFDDSFYKLLNEVKTYKSFRYFKAAVEDAGYEYDKTKNPLVGQRTLEMYLASPVTIANIVISEATNGNLYRALKKDTKEVYDKLMKEYKKDPSNELVKFALGKNIVLIQPICFNVNEKVMKFGKGLLRELANRPMIVTFNPTSITPRVKR